MNKTIEPGAFVRIFRWEGVVKNVYTSASNGEQVIEVYFAKNAVKAQPPELHNTTPLIVEPSTEEDYIEQLMDMLQVARERAMEAIV